MICLDPYRETERERQRERERERERESAWPEKLRQIPMTSKKNKNKKKLPTISYWIVLESTFKFDNSGLSIKIRTFISCPLDVLNFFFLNFEENV